MRTAFIKGTVELRVKIEITRDMLHTIMDSAVAGISHWAFQMYIGETGDEGDFIKRFLDGETLVICDGITGTKHEMNVSTLMDGISSYLRSATPPDGGFLKWEDHELKADEFRITDNIADSIVQLALFDEIRYRKGVRL